MDKELKLFGIFGHPLSHTLSPVFQEAGFDEAGLLAHYLAFDFNPHSFKRVMRSLNKLPLKGFNLTIPYKQTVIPYLDWITEEAKAIGAVNTVYRFGKKWYGTNTDAEGFWRSLAEKWKWKARGQKVLIIGAGGAARAVLYALASRGVRSITLWNRTNSKARELVKYFSKLFPKVKFFTDSRNSGSKADITAFDLIINATSVGLNTKDKSLIDSKCIPSASHGRKFFVDLIYKPAETSFLRLARKKGHQTLNGLPMLLHQGARAFEIWTGRRAPIKAMTKALTMALEGSKK